MLRWSLAVAALVPWLPAGAQAVRQFDVHKVVEGSTCTPAPRTVDQRITVTRSDSLATLDDGNGTWQLRVGPDGRFTSDARTGQLADGAELRVTMTGTLGDSTFGAVLAGERGAAPSGSPACRYAVRWTGTPVVDRDAEEARRRLAHRAGVWDIEMQMLDDSGRVTRTVTGTDTAVAIGDGAVLRIVTRFPALGEYSLSWMFRDTQDSLFKNVSVDDKGNYWELSGGLDEFVLASRDRRIPAGTLRIRFTHRDLTPDGFVAAGEYTLDNGTTWVPLSRQVFRRKRP